MKVIKSTLLISSIMLMTILLAGCGFHLRQPVTFNPQLQTLYIATKQPNSPFIQVLKRTLLANDLKIADTPKEATATLNILNIDETTALTSLRGGGSAGQYTARATITFSVTSSNGKILLPASTVTHSSHYSSNATQILSSKTQSQDLISTMQTQLANLIINQLASINHQPAASKTPTTTHLPAKSITAY